MTLEAVNWELDQWELDQCRYCKGPIEDPTESYCSSSCELKWIKQHDEHNDYSPSSSVFSVHAIHSVQSTPHSTPASSANSSPTFNPTVPSGSVPNLPLDAYPICERRHSYVLKSHKYGSSHNPVKKSFPSNYYQSTIGDRSGFQPIFADKSVSLGIRKNSTDDIRTSPKLQATEPSKEITPDNKPRSPTELSGHSTLWSWRRLSALI